MSLSSQFAQYARAAPPSVAGERVPTSAQASMKRHLGDSGLKSFGPSVDNQTIQAMTRPAGAWLNEGRNNLIQNGALSYIVMSKFFGADDDLDFYVGPNGVAPLITSDTTSVTVEQGIFYVTLPVRHAPRGQVHMGSYSMTSKRYSLTDYGFGCEFALRVLEEPGGDRLVRLGIEQLNIGFEQHLILTAIKGVTEQLDWVSQYWHHDMRKASLINGQTVDAWLARETSNLNMLADSPAPMERLRSVIEANVSPYAGGDQAARPDTLLLPREIFTSLSQNPAYTEFYRAGENGPRFRQAGEAGAEAALSAMLGMRVRVIKDNLVNGSQLFNFMENNYRIGGFSVFADDDDDNGSTYTTKSRSLQLFSGEKDDWHTISLGVALRGSERWNTPDKGDYLATLSPEILSQPGAQDSFYTNIDGDWVLHRFMGMQPTAFIPTTKVEKLARSAQRRMDTLTNVQSNSGAVVQAIATLQRAQAIMEDVPVDATVDFWAGRLHEANKGQTISRTELPGVNIMTSEFQLPRNSALPAAVQIPNAQQAAFAGAANSNALWPQFDLPPFCASGPGFRAIRKATRVNAPNWNLEFAMNRDTCVSVAAAYDIIESVARYLNSFMPESAAINPAYTDVNMRQNFVDTFVANLLTGKRAPVYLYAGGRNPASFPPGSFTNATAPPTGQPAAATGARPAAGYALRISEALGVSVAYRAAVEDRMTGRVIDSIAGRATAQALRTQAIQLVSANVTAGANRNVSLLFDTQTPAIVGGGASVPKDRFAAAPPGTVIPIVVDDNGLVDVARCSESGRRVLKLITNFVYPDTTQQTQVANTEAVRAVLLFLLSKINVDDVTLVDARLDAFFNAVNGFDPAFTATLDALTNAPMAAPASAELYAGLFGSATAAIAAFMATQVNGVSIFSRLNGRTFEAQANEIKAAAQRIASLPRAEFVALTDAASADPNIGGAAAGSPVDVSGDFVYHLTPLNYSPSQLISYKQWIDAIATGGAGRFVSNLGFASPTNFGRRMGAAEVANAAQTASSPGALDFPAVYRSLDDGPGGIENLPAVIFGRQYMDGINANLSETNDVLPKKNERDPYLAAVAERDVNFKMQIENINNVIADPLLRIIAICWAMLPISFAAVQKLLDNDVLVPFTVLAFRWNIVLNTVGAIAVRSGAQNVIFANPICTWATIADSQLVTALLSFSSGYVPKDEMAVQHLHNLLITGFSDGFDTSTLSRASYYRSNNGQNRSGSSYRAGSIAYVVEPLVFTSTRAVVPSKHVRHDPFQYVPDAGYGNLMSAWGSWSTFQTSIGGRFDNATDTHYHNSTWVKQHFGLDEATAVHRNAEQEAAVYGSATVNNMSMWREPSRKFSKDTGTWVADTGMGPLKNLRKDIVRSWRTGTSQACLPVC